MWTVAANFRRTHSPGRLAWSEVGGHPALSLDSSNEPGELNSRNDFGHDDSTKALSWLLLLLLLLLLLTPVLNSQGMKKYAMQYKKVQKSIKSSSSSFTKQSCSKMALYR